MNKLIFNYRLDIDEVLDGRTFSGLMDFGFRLYQHRTFQLAALELPEPRDYKGIERQGVEETLVFAKDVLRALLIASDGKGRRIIVSPHEPNKYGRTYVSAYVCCDRENVEYPNLTVLRATYRFINVCYFMQHALEQDLTLADVNQLITGFVPCDFSK